MALINVIKYEDQNDMDFVWKFPSDKIKLGSQLIVNEGQNAIFVKGGQALDIFLPGTHTLTTGNIPLLDKLINLPFGGDTPFSAEVWFISTTVKRDLKWGTPTSLQIMDPSIGFPVNARSFGRWGARVKTPRAFMSQLVGAQVLTDSNKIKEYFIGQIIQKLSACIGSMVTSGQSSIFHITGLLNEISSYCSVEIANELNKFGIELVNFDIESINIPEHEMEKIQAVFAKSMEVRELSKVNTGGAYAAVKSFDVMNNAAQNPNDNTIGAMMGMGVGLGAGFPIGQQMGNQMSIQDTNPEEQSNKRNNKSSVEKLQELKEMYELNLINKEQFESKQKEILSDL